MTYEEFFDRWCHVMAYVVPIAVFVILGCVAW